jgi:hypothetical protein
MYNFGPINLRPHLEENRLAKGGGGEVFVATSIFFYQLPFMTLGTTRDQGPATLRLDNGAPPFADLLTFDLFLHRASLIKSQAQELLKHPFFEQIAFSCHIGRTERSRMTALG